MQTLQVEVEIKADRQLSIELPLDVEVGKYQIVLVMQPQLEQKQLDITSKHPVNQFAGKVKSFAGVEAIALQREMRAEWDEA